MALAIVKVFAFITLCSVLERTLLASTSAKKIVFTLLLRTEDPRFLILSGYFSWNTTFAVCWVATGLPSCVAGLYFQRLFTIVQAASSRRGLPLEVATAHSLTDPFGSMTNLMATVPCSCRRI